MLNEHSIVTWACISCKKSQPHRYAGRSMTGHKIRCEECGYTVTFVDVRNIPLEAIKQEGVPRGEATLS